MHTIVPLQYHVTLLHNTPTGMRLVVFLAQTNDLSNHLSKAQIKVGISSMAFSGMAISGMAISEL